MLPSMVSGCPSLIQVTVVAGEPVEIQVSVDDMYSWVNPRCVILGGSGEEMTHSLKVGRASPSNPRDSPHE